MQHTIAGARHKLMANMQVCPPLAVRIATDLAKDRTFASSDSMNAVQLLTAISIISLEHAHTSASDSCKMLMYHGAIDGFDSVVHLTRIKARNLAAALTLIY